MVVVSQYKYLGLIVDKKQKNTAHKNTIYTSAKVYLSLMSLWKGQFQAMFFTKFDMLKYTYDFVWC